MRTTKSSGETDEHKARTALPPSPVPTTLVERMPPVELGFQAIRRFRSRPGGAHVAHITVRGIKAAWFPRPGSSDPA